MKAARRMLEIVEPEESLQILQPDMIINQQINKHKLYSTSAMFCLINGMVET